MIRRFLDSPWPYFLAAIVLLVMAIASQFEVRFPSREKGGAADIAALRERDDVNLVFILIDTLRADRLGVYGYPRPTSPTIDALAASGIVFKQVLSQSSWTKTSMASLWTGTLPANHGISRFNHAMPREATMPAEIFREHGFRTAGVWRNGWVAPNFGFDQGFEVYMRPKTGRERHMIQRRTPGTHKLSGTDEDLLYAAMDFLDNFGREKFFLYLHAMDVHQYVYDGESAVFGTSYSDVYDQSIHWVDRLIGVLVDKLDTLDLLPRTVIVIASDHGEAFQEHGTEGHAKNLFHEVTEVPLVISLPFLLDPPLALEHRISNVDVWPTLLDLFGLPPLPNADGASQLPAILAAAGAESGVKGSDRVVFNQLDRRWGNPKVEPDPIVGVSEGDLRLIVRYSRGDEGVVLYDRSTDPLETNDLSETRPEDAARLRALADGYLESARSPWGKQPDEVELDEMKLEQLRALGYVIK